MLFFLLLLNWHSFDGNKCVWLLKILGRSENKGAGTVKGQRHSISSFSLRLRLWAPGSHQVGKNPENNGRGTVEVRKEGEM